MNKTFSLKDIVKLDEQKNTYLQVKVTTKQPKTEIYNILEDGTIKIRLRAVPEKGKANKELIGYISTDLGVDKNKITIISGASSENKIIRIEASLT